MIIYVDADSIAQFAKTLIIKTANRTKTLAVFVANHTIYLPSSPFLQLVVVGHGFDVADNYIIQNINVCDLVITSDIPLADCVIAKGTKVLTQRGDELTNNNIKSKLARRNLMDMMRGTVVLELHQMGQPKPPNDKDKKRLADALNRLVLPKKPT